MARYFNQSPVGFMGEPSMWWVDGMSGHCQVDYCVMDHDGDKAGFNAIEPKFDVQGDDFVLIIL